MHEEFPALKIVQNFSPKKKRILDKSGVPHSAFMRANTSIILDECVSKIEAELSKTRIRRISVSRQLRAFESFISNPLWGSSLYVISSYPSDLRAKQVALYVMSKAMDNYYKRKESNKLLIKRGPPVWHNIMGGYRDKYLDGDITSCPSMLILANVIEDSTQIKLEKLRDILVKYDRVPRIVVTAAIDPVSFMLGKLKHQLDGSLYISPDDRTNN